MVESIEADVRGKREGLGKRSHHAITEEVDFMQRSFVSLGFLFLLFCFGGFNHVMAKAQERHAYSLSFLLGLSGIKQKYQEILSYSFETLFGFWTQSLVFELFSDQPGEMTLDSSLKLDSVPLFSGQQDVYYYSGRLNDIIFFRKFLSIVPVELGIQQVESCLMRHTDWLSVINPLLLSPVVQP